MPNWVYSNLTVTGPRKEIIDFAESLICKSESIINFRDVLRKDGIDPSKVDKKTFYQYYNKVMLGVYDTSYDEIEKVGFSRLIPKPEGEVRVDFQSVKLPEGFKWDLRVDGWYGWNCENWGSKWGMCDVAINQYKAYVNKLKQEEGDELTFELSFTTAWSASTVAFKKISEIYKELEFSCIYEEESGLFFLEERYLNGESFEDFCTDNRAKLYCHLHEDFKEALNGITYNGDEDVIEEMLEPDSYLMQEVVDAAKCFYPEEQIVSSVDSFVERYNIAPDFKDKFLETMGYSTIH